MKKRFLLFGLALCIMLTLAPNAVTFAETEVKVKAIAAGQWHGLAIDTDGGLWAWGSNVYGALGVAISSTTIPVKVMDDVVCVSTSSLYTMAIKKDGSLWGWGYNNKGYLLGDDPTATYYIPVKLMDNAAAVSAGSYHAMVIKTDGSLWAWGSNGDGRIGNGTNAYQYEPLKIMDDVAAVSAGGMHSLAVKTDGSLWAWGYNKEGQLGDGTTSSRSTPVKIMDDAADVFACSWNSLAIKKDGSLWMWGSNGSGPLGDASSDRVSTDNYNPAMIMENVIAASICVSRILAVKADNSLWEWEDIWWWEKGTAAEHLSPIKIMHGVTETSAEHGHAFAIDTNGNLLSWGHNWQGQLGDGTTNSWSSFEPAQVRLAPGLPQNSVNIDTASPWAHSHIIEATGKGFVPADIQDNYQDVITRAEFCRLAVKWVEYATGKSIDEVLAEKSLTRNPNAFTDTTNPDILAAYALGITAGTGDGTFSPDGQFTREQAATMIMNTCRAIGASVEIHTSFGFADIGSASGWAVDGINFVGTNGIMSGTGNGNFSPKDTYTREQGIITFNNINHNSLPGR
jgi:alpha-tubulin suppressor-like RCC1 family protein